ncbi:MAG: hypothetical protein KDE28_22030, partial [Anaerolineales bacterium]|nr:hypothetical protein [Anaerolineales bacterium]
LTVVSRLKKRRVVVARPAAAAEKLLFIKNLLFSLDESPLQNDRLSNIFAQIAGHHLPIVLQMM